MNSVKEELKKVLVEVMIPESQDYLEELNNALSNKSNEDDLSAKKEIENFIEELHTIIHAIDEDKISTEDAQEIYTKITEMIEEHKA